MSQLTAFFLLKPVSLSDRSFSFFLSLSLLSLSPSFLPLFLFLLLSLGNEKVKTPNWVVKDGFLRDEGDSRSEEADMN